VTEVVGVFVRFRAPLHSVRTAHVAGDTNILPDAVTRAQARQNKLVAIASAAWSDANNTSVGVQGGRLALDRAQAHLVSMLRSRTRSTATAYAARAFLRWRACAASRMDAAVRHMRAQLRN
jgi:hypothetical protein